MLDGQLSSAIPMAVCPSLHPSAGIFLSTGAPGTADLFRGHLSLLLSLCLSFSFSSPCHGLPPPERVPVPWAVPGSRVGMLQFPGTGARSPPSAAPGHGPGRRGCQPTGNNVLWQRETQQTTKICWCGKCSATRSHNACLPAPRGLSRLWGCLTHRAFPHSLPFFLFALSLFSSLAVLSLQR